MHIFIMSVTSVTYLQSSEKIQWKLLEEFSQSMTYQPLFTWYSHPKMFNLKNPVSLSKNIFSASNFFMHIFNMSVTYL